MSSCERIQFVNIKWILKNFEYWCIHLFIYPHTYLFCLCSWWFQLSILSQQNFGSDTQQAKPLVVTEEFALPGFDVPGMRCQTTDLGEDSMIPLARVNLADENRISFGRFPYDSWLSFFLWGGGVKEFEWYSNDLKWVFADFQDCEPAFDSCFNLGKML